MNESTPLSQAIDSTTATIQVEDEVKRKNEQNLATGRWLSILTAVLLIFKTILDTYLVLHIPRHHGFRPKGHSVLEHSVYFIVAMDALSVLVCVGSVIPKLRKGFRYVFIINLSLMLCIILVWGTVNSILDAVLYHKRINVHFVLELLGANMYNIIVCVLGVLIARFMYKWMRI
jgi:hypothetical protein